MRISITAIKATGDWCFTTNSVFDIFGITWFPDVI